MIRGTRRTGGRHHFAARTSWGGLVGVMSMSLVAFEGCAPVTPLCAAAGKASPAAGKASPTADRVTTLRSVTYYRFPVGLAKLDLARFRRDAAAAKQLGFNGMWLVVCWRDLCPTALPTVQTDDTAWRKLDRCLDVLSQQGFSVLFPLGYFGRGWAPAGLPPDRLVEWMVDPRIWPAYEDYVLRVCRRYAGRRNLLWLFYSESFQGPLGAYRNAPRALASFRAYCQARNADLKYWNQRWGSDYRSFADLGIGDGRCSRGATRWEDHFRWVCQVLRDHYGELARRLKAEVGIEGLLGFHDNALITKNWAKGDTPIPADNPYDFLSFTGYFAGGEVEARVRNLDEIRRRFGNRYPGVPLLLGETGVSTTIPDGEQIQAQYLAAVARFARQKVLGVNVWMWQDLERGSDKERSFGLLRLDGTPKPAVEALRREFSRPSP